MILIDENFRMVYYAIKYQFSNLTIVGGGFSITLTSSSSTNPAEDGPFRTKDFVFCRNIK